MPKAHYLNPLIHMYQGAPLAAGRFTPLVLRFIQFSLWNKLTERTPGVTLDKVFKMAEGYKKSSGHI